jgi:translation initiation factor 2 beta subunit (eIF-2beta)/eIF-5
VHQKLVHPSKHIAYAAFWIRKLKPVDSSYPVSEIERATRTKTPIDESLEIRDVNERICLHYMFRLLNSYVSEGHVKPPHKLKKDDFLANIHRVFINFINERDQIPVLNDRFEAIVYDMRYRTFGPHHVVHLVNYLLTEASHHGNN